MLKATAVWFVLALMSSGCFAQDVKHEPPVEWTRYPAPAQINKTLQLNGRTLHYTATVGALPVLDEQGHTTAEVFYVAYTLPNQKAARRPITFAFNGGPGSASVFLHFGAFGPTRVSFGNQGDMPSDAVRLSDNPGTWLDFTDLVFIDPVGTGYSRSWLNPADSQKRFYGTHQDVAYLSLIVRDWLAANGRMTSPVYLAGESYGGYRVPAMAYRLQTLLGVGVQGEVLVSPALDNAQRFDPAHDVGSISPMPFVVSLPSFAAAHLEQQGLLDASHMAPVLDYARGDYIVDLMKGASDSIAQERLIRRVTELTGLEADYVRRTGGRIEVGDYVRERARSQGMLSSLYDINVTAVDPFPRASVSPAGDPVLDRMVSRATVAVTDFVTREVGWKVTAPYVSISYAVNEQWNGGRPEHWESATDLRRSLAVDVGLKVLIAHGWTDLACPVLSSMLILDQMPDWPNPARVKLSTYAGGHMFYTRPASAAALRQDVRQMYAENLDDD
jgi:carboxypeptidase C (cathepsin A)